ncbi:exported protein of unknown function [Candidatus Methylopumilus planktonicus]|uniref:Autotransporter domain-containing protein n=1 Tax=Candidatus Methylopumilus planktonicus TaxID=1581557 RepID=A0A0D6EWH1_9PROT|nr:hypothetical protein [Candidatus Methylopumilus planktonicus]CEZ19821.1 exported protein of unknown function [Candidatus Methylopumilus planktonicus]
MRKFFSLSQCFLFCLAILFSFKSFATCTSSGTPITSAGSYTGNIGVCDSSKGIYLSNGNNSIVNMTGNITAINEDNSNFNVTVGIYLENFVVNRNSIVNLTGNVTTSGFNSYGIYLYNVVATGSTNMVNMTGNISIAGGTSFNVNAGILMDNTFSPSSSNTTNITGNITGSDNYLFGIGLNNTGSSDSSNTANMSGNIMLSGNNSRGIDLQRHNTSSIDANTVNIIGNVTTSGNDSRGISLYTSGSTGSNIVNLTGRISATGSNSYAIYASNASSMSSNIVQLNKGSSVIGAISGVGDYTANNFLKLNLGAGASYSFATTGFTVQDLNGRPMVTGSANAAGIGNVSTASQSLYERTSQITQSLDDRVRTYDAKQNTTQDFWINTYYSDSSRGGQGLSGSNLSFNQYRSGIMAGFNVKNSYTPTELIVNYEHGQLNIDEGNQGISFNSVMAGALFPDIKKLFTGTLSAKAMVGYSDFNGDRKVLTNDVAFNGSRNVTASYQSSHLTIGSAWTKTLYQTDKIILDTLVGIDLNTQHINSYSESDLFKWNGRTINQLQERVTLGMEMKPLVKPLTLYGRVGVERRDLISGENQNYAINNTAVSYNDSNQGNTYRTINAGAYYPLTPTVKAYAQVRYYDSTKDIDSLSGSIGISGQF